MQIFELSHQQKNNNKQSSQKNYEYFCKLTKKIRKWEFESFQSFSLQIFYCVKNESEPRKLT